MNLSKDAEISESRPHLSEVSRMPLVHQCAVVMLATSVTAASGVTPVFADPTVTRAHFSTHFAVL